MTATGRCLCGAISCEVAGPLRDVVDCHCHRCRRHTGHFMAATHTATVNLTISGEEAIRWYRATDDVEYGFCGTCGSSLFWRSADRADLVSIAAGTLDPPTGLTTVAALFVDSASDYHRLDDSLRQYPGDAPA